MLAAAAAGLAAVRHDSNQWVNLLARLVRVNCTAKAKNCPLKLLFPEEMVVVGEPAIQSKTGIDGVCPRERLCSKMVRSRSDTAWT